MVDFISARGFTTRDFPGLMGGHVPGVLYTCIRDFLFIANDT